MTKTQKTHLKHEMTLINRKYKECDIFCNMQNTLKIIFFAALYEVIFYIIIGIHYYKHHKIS